MDDAQGARTKFPGHQSALASQPRGHRNAVDLRK